MGGETRTKEPRDTGSILFALIVAGIVVAAGAVAYVVYLNSQRLAEGTPYEILAGDQVSVDYVGRFSDGRVFDTSILSIAQNDTLYPKSLTFSLRANDTYKPLSMKAGNYGSGGTIKGFALGVIGLHAGDYRIIEVPPDEGYPVDPTRLTTVNLTEEVSVVEVYNLANYVDYFGTAPVLFSTQTHYFWKWPVFIANVTGDSVMILNQPTVGSSVYPFGDPNSASDPSGWEVRVMSYDPSANGGIGEITVRNMVTADDVYNVKGTDISGTVFIVDAFDATNESFQIHWSNSDTGYNAELAGRTLFFEITIVSVEPAGS